MQRWRVSIFGDRLHVVVEEDAKTGIENLKKRLSAEGIKVFEAYEETRSLEDVFIAVVESKREN